MEQTAVPAQRCGWAGITTGLSNFGCLRSDTQNLRQNEIVSKQTIHSKESALH